MHRRRSKYFRVSRCYRHPHRSRILISGRCEVGLPYITPPFRADLSLGKLCACRDIPLAAVHCKLFSVYPSTIPHIYTSDISTLSLVHTNLSIYYRTVTPVERVEDCVPKRPDERRNLYVLGIPFDLTKSAFITFSCPLY